MTGGTFGTAGRAILAGDRDRLELAGLNLPQHARHGIEQHIHLLAHQCADRFGRGAERYVHDIDAGGLVEQRRGHVLGGAEAGRRERQLAGIGLRGGDQILDGVAGKVRSRHDDEAGGRDLPIESNAVS